MENSTSLRFLEASGRPSGTGRPSLPPPRADQDRASGSRRPADEGDELAQAADDARELRRKSRPHEAPRAAASAASQQAQQPFEKLLGDARQAPADESQQAAASNPDANVTTPTATAAPAKAGHDSGSAKTKKSAAREPGSASSPSADPAALETPTAAIPQAGQAGEARTGHMRADALALPATDTVAAAGPAPASTDATPTENAPAASPSATAQAGDAPSAAAPDLAQAGAQERAPLVQPALTPETRLDGARPVEAKAPPAPPPTADHSERAGEILRQLRVQLSPELRTATIQLSPPELGRISIRIRVQNGELHALVRAEKRETLDALQRHVPELEATLEQIGIRAREFDLQLGFEQQGARQSPHEPPPGRGSAGHEHDPRAREHERRLLRTLSARAGGIDTYA